MRKIAMLVHDAQNPVLVDLGGSVEDFRLIDVFGRITHLDHTDVTCAVKKYLEAIDARVVIALRHDPLDCGEG